METLRAKKHKWGLVGFVLVLLISTSVLLFGVSPILGQTKGGQVRFLNAPLRLQCKGYKAALVRDVMVVPIVDVSLPRDMYMKSLLYEIMVRYKTSLVPLDGLVINGDITDFYCNKPDFVLGTYQDDPKVVFGFVGDDIAKNRDALQKLVEKYKVTQISQGALGLDDDGKIIVKRLSDVCTLPYCEGVVAYPDLIGARNYRIDVLGVEYPKEVTNPQEVSIRVRFKNATEYALPSSELVPLVLKEVSNLRIPELYSYTWQDLKLVGVVNEGGVIEPQKEFTYEFKVGPYLKPGQRTSQFALVFGDREVGQRFEVSIDFKKGDYDLGVIVTEYRAVNVRKGPDIRSEVVFKLLPGDYVIWHKQEGAWVYIETAEGNTGWVYRRFIRKYVAD